MNMFEFKISVHGNLESDDAFFEETMLYILEG